MAIAPMAGRLKGAMRGLVPDIPLLIPLLKVVPPWPGGQGNKLDVVADFFCEILRTVSRSPTHRAKSRYLLAFSRRRATDRF